MNAIEQKRRRVLRPRGWLLSLLLTFPLLTACGGSQTTTPPPPVDDTRGGVQTSPAPTQSPQAKKGLTTGQKVGITLVGAAALYYLYNQHKKKQGEGAQGQYYLSKNGRVYYRDAEHRAHYVTPPKEGIKVPEEEAQQYRDFKGYNNQPTGRDLTGVGADAVPTP